MANPAIGLKSFTDLPVAVAIGTLPSAALPAKPPQSAKSNGLGSLGLTSNPFSKASVAGYVPLTASVQFAIAQLRQGIESQKGLLVVSGEPGTGKTTVLNQLRTWLAEKSASTAFLFNPLLDTRNFFDFVLAEFGLKVGPASHGNAFTHLSNWLFARHRQGALAVLIVDEAQGLSGAVLQALGCLLNLEVSGEKLLQIVLSGQPELNDRLRAPDLRQFRQRITVRCRTAPLTAEEAQSYVHDRLRAANANGKPVFSSEALDAVHFYSAGIPRVINLLCEHALISACRLNVQPVAPSFVEEVAHEFQLDDLLPCVRHRNPEYSDEVNARMMRGATLARGSSPPAFTLADKINACAHSLPVAPAISLKTEEDRVVGAAPAASLAPASAKAGGENTPQAPALGPDTPTVVQSRHDRGWVKVYSGHSMLRAGRQHVSDHILEPLHWLLSVAEDEMRHIWRATLTRLKTASSQRSRPVRSVASLSLPSVFRSASISLTHWLKSPMRAPQSRRR